MPFDFPKESAQTKRLIDEFHRAYLDGEDDKFLKDKAKEIFERLHIEDRNSPSGSAAETAIRRVRRDFEAFVEQICINRGALATPELGKYFAEHRTKN